MSTTSTKKPIERSVKTSGVPTQGISSSESALEFKKETLAKRPLQKAPKKEGAMDLSRSADRLSTDSSASEPASWFDLLGWKEGDIEGVRSLGYAYLEQGCYERARLLFEGLTGLDRAEVADLQILGAISLELNKPEQAVEWLGQALALDPHHLPSLLNRAKALFALGAKDRAIPIAQRLLQAEDLAIAKVAEALLMGHAPESLPFDSSSV